MRRSEQAWLVAGFLVCATILGIPYLTADYSALESTGVVWGWGLAVLFVAALLVRLIGRPPTLLAALAPVAALLAVVILRIIMDVAIDPTDHSLWPLEIVIAGFLGGAASLMGALVGAGLSRLVRKDA